MKTGRIIQAQICLLLTAFVAMLMAVPIHAAGKQALRDRVPAAVAKLKPLGRLAITQQLKVDIGLPLRNQAELTALLAQISDPASPNYHHYLTPGEFTARFGPTESDYQAVVNFAKARGLKVTTHPNRMLVDVEGSVPAIEKTFYVTMMSYQHPSDGRKFYAPSGAPSIDLTVPILGVSGLNDYSLPQPRLKRASLKTLPDQGVARLAAPADDTPVDPLPNATGSGPNTGFMGADFRTAYAPGVTLTGTGQTIGLLQFDGYSASDINYYESVAGLPAVPITNVLLDGFNGSPSGNGGEIEVSLDIEMAISMAPGAAGIVVYMAGPTGSFHDILNRMVTDNTCKQIGCSWYLQNGVADSVADQIFQQMAAQGQSFFSASGDNDAFTGLIPFPGDTPYITEVGGTMLTTSDAGGAYSSEAVWNRNNGIGTGGGISTQYSIPSWQQGISMATNLGSTTMRNVPDVALTAEAVYVRANGTNYLEGGTSCAAPLWAGFTALVNQRSVMNSGTTVGFINPALYAIGKGASYATAFHDTTSGNNFSSTSPTKFPGTTGYDLCTGWGTPIGAGMIDALAGPATPIISTTSPLISGAAGTFYTKTLAANGGTPAYTYTLLSGSLPANVTLSSGGVISGTPPSPGQFSFTVKVADSLGAFSTKAFALTIYLSGSPIVTTSTPLPMAFPGVSYTQSLSATGGTTPYTWTLFGGALPGNVNLSTDGTISGTPASAGTFTFTVQVTGQDGIYSFQQFSLTVATPPTITNGSTLASGVINAPYSLSLAATGGTTPYAFSLFSGALPSGLTLSSLGSISGTPLATGTASFTVKVTGGDGAFSTKAFNLTIASSGALDHFAWNTIGSQNVNVPFSTTITAKDSVNNTVTSFTGTTNLSGRAGVGSSSIVMSEIDTGAVDAIEFVNISGAAVDISGWQFIAYDWNSWPAPSQTVTIPQGTVCPANQIFMVRENGNSPGTFPNFYVSGNIYWNNSSTGNPVAALLRDSAGNIVDFVCAYDAVPSQITTPIPIPTSQWTSSPIAANTSTSVTYQRKGSTDQNSNADWTTAAPSLGTLNTGMTIPFTGVGTIPITPAISGAFTSGIWTGNVTVTQPATGMLLVANDASSHTGISNAFNVSTSAGMGVTPAGGLSSSGSAGGPFTPSSQVYTVSNTGSASMNWTVSATAPWVTLSTSGGTLANGGSTNVTVSINSNANALGSSSYSDTVTFTNTTNDVGDTVRSVSLAVLPSAPVINSPATAVATVGQLFSYQITATNNPTSFNATGLPVGLGVNTATGLISGTPTASGGPYSVTLSASNGATGTATLGLTLLKAPAFSNGPPPAATINTAYSFAYTATGYPAPAFSVTGGALPVGLTLTTAGLLSGTPTLGGTYTGTVSLANSSGTVTQNFTITVLFSFSDWQQLYFSAAQLQDPTISGPNATPQHDGISNLLKYLFDIDPSKAMSESDKAALPKVGLTNVSGTNYLTLTFRQSVYMTNVTLNVQTSTDLQTWQTVTPAVSQQISTDATTGDPIMQVGVPLAGGKEFIRLNITTP